MSRSTVAGTPAVNMADRFERRVSNRRRSASASRACPRSSMTPARHMNGMATTERKTWRASTASAAGTVANSPCPCVPAEIAIQTIVASARLTPPGPKRTAAQRKRGRTNASGV